MAYHFTSPRTRGGNSADVETGYGAMKSKERHRLETNWLAKNLNVTIERYRPYFSTIVGVGLAIVVVIFVWWRMAGGSAARQAAAWSAFEGVVGTPISTRPMVDQSLTHLSQAAEEYAGTAMQKWANLAWADGQVFVASLDVLQNRDAAMAALDRAARGYQTAISSADDEELVNRARFGMARVHEMRNEPDKAREFYLMVEGGFAPLAKLRAEALAEEKTRKTLDWLATAEVPRSAARSGGGTPGGRTLLDVEDFALPDATGGTDPTKLDIDEMFKGIDLQLGTGAGESTDRYGTGEPTTGDGETTTGDEQSTPDDEKTATGENESTTGTEKTTTEGGGTAPGDEKTATEGGAVTPADQPVDNSATSDAAADQVEK